VEQKEIAEDLVQETFLSAYQSFENYQGKKQCENLAVFHSQT
jgi:DNA-directed RNA polymerase specialized sigma24 family protein